MDQKNGNKDKPGKNVPQSDVKDGKDDKTNKDDKKDKNEANDEKNATAAAVRPPRKLPKITLKMPSNSTPLPQFYNTPSGMVTIPLTPATGLPSNCQIDVFQAYPNKAQEFMFKQFSDFKDFTKNTGKLGLSFGERFAFWCYGKARGLSTNSFTHIFLLIIVGLYCALGGLAFFFFENEQRQINVSEMKKADNDAVKNVTGEIYSLFLTDGLVVKDQTKHRNKLEREVKEKIEEILVTHYHKQYQLDQKTEEWGLINSMYFCGTLFTTIGYGHLAPVTTAGRIITIVYAIFGIPLFLILLADYGKLLTRGIKFVWAYVRRLYYTGSCRKVRKTAPVQEVVKGMQLVLDNVNKVRKFSNAKLEEPVVPRPVSPTDTPAMSTYTVDDNFNLPISVAFTILVLYIIGGAFLFSFLEGWNLFVAFYFVFISTSTIGLGDFVPKGNVWVLLCSLVYFVFGLALTTMCINVVTEKLTDSFRAATAKIGATMGLEIAEEATDMDLKEEDN